MEEESTCQKDRYILESCPKNTDSGAGEQEEMRTQQLRRQQKLIRDGDVMGGGRKEETDVPICFKSIAL